MSSLPDQSPPGATREWSWRYFEAPEIKALGASHGAARFASWVQARFYVAGETRASLAWLAEAYGGDASRVRKWAAELVAVGVWHRVEATRLAAYSFARPDRVEGTRQQVEATREQAESTRQQVEATRSTTQQVEGTCPSGRGDPSIGSRRPAIEHGEQWTPPRAREARAAAEALVVEVRVSDALAPIVVDRLTEWLEGRQDIQADLDRIGDRARKSGSPAGWLVHACREGILDEVAFGVASDPGGPADTSGPTARSPEGVRVSPSVWDYDLERAVVLALGEGTATAGRTQLASRYGSVPEALARFEKLVGAAPESLPNVLHARGVAGWREAVPRLRERLMAAPAHQPS